MKKSMFLFGALFAAGLSFTACSSSDEVAANDGPNRLVENGEGYISIGISMPSDASARTRANDVFDDGDADEYEVSDAYLLLFTGANESTSTFAGIYQLNANPLSDHSSDQITKEATVTTKINSSMLTGANVYAYVIINQNGVVKSYDPNSPGSFTFEASDGDKSISSSTAFSTFSGYTLAASTIHNGNKKHFLMTNAVVSHLRGGNYNPSGEGAGISTLALLDKSKIYATQSEAQADPAGHVDVERAAVKVTVACSASTLTGDANITFDFFGWALGNTNETYYNTRKWTSTASDWLKLKAETGDEGTPNAATLYRFVSKAYLDNGTTLSDEMDQDRARTYWCEDPNYTGKSGLTNTTVAAGNYSNGGGTSDYTTENTFDVAHMTFENTTYVAVNLKFNGGADFYTASTYGESKILQKSEDDGYSHAEGKESVKEYILKTYLSSRDDIQAYMTANGTPAADRLDAFKITMTNNEATGEAEIATFTTAAGKPEWSSTIALPTVDDLNTAIKFKYFKGGQSYYGVRIKHFGAGGTTNSTTGKESDCETPWNNKIHSTNSVEGVYQQKVVNGTTTAYDADQQNNNFLGRYGVVRNNWYDVNITSVRKIGSPIPLTPDDTPDDEIENYLSVKIHILSWAKRTQNADL